MAKQLHKRFSTEEVKMLLQKYVNENVELVYILEIFVDSGAKLPSVLEQTCHPFWLKVYHFLGKYQNDQEHSL